MNFHILTLFPGMIVEGLNTSITGRAIKNDKISINAINIRDFADNDYGQIDDYPYGGGAGMVIMPNPVFDAYKSVLGKTKSKPRVVYMTPQGKTFNQEMAKEFSKEEDLIILCGHYEGIDERVIEEIVTDEVSIGDYVLTGGELASMVFVDAVTRLIPGVLNNDDSSVDESFTEGLLEYPQYTRPDTFNGKKVPEILLSGNHAKVDEWRRNEAIKRTASRRPDMLKDAKLSDEEQEIVDEILLDK